MGRPTQWLTLAEVPYPSRGYLDFASQPITQGRKQTEGTIDMFCRKCGEANRRAIVDLRKVFKRGGQITGVCKKCRSNGRAIYADGYVMVKDPSGKKSYTQEHRVIMAQFLGRPLQGAENVHHKNGIRTDNRIENLELCVIRQPSGQRVLDLTEGKYVDDEGAING